MQRAILKGGAMCERPRGEGVEMARKQWCNLASSCSVHDDSAGPSTSKVSSALDTRASNAAWLSASFALHKAYPDY
eukprot:1241008-Pleurochrysis_carterae.AAC.1